MTFAEKIRRIRYENGLTQSDLARKLGTSQSAIFYWENGRRTPSIKLLRKIEETFNISPGYLLDDKNSMNDTNVDEYNESKNRINQSINNIMDIEKSLRLKLFEVTEMLNAVAIGELLNKSIDMLQDENNRSVFYKSDFIEQEKSEENND